MLLDGIEQLYKASMTNDDNDDDDDNEKKWDPMNEKMMLKAPCNLFLCAKIASRFTGYL